MRLLSMGMLGLAAVALSACANVGNDARVAPVSASVSPLAALIAPVETPPGVSVRITDLGAVFVNAAGMTLYKWSGKVPCTYQRPVPDDSLHILQRIYLEVRTATCADQNQPFIAAADAQPVGDWKIIETADGLRQWTYQGLAVHLSRRNVLPGDVNENVIPGLAVRRTYAIPLEAPLLLPPGMKATYLRGSGVIVRSRDDKPLYTLDASRGRGLLQKASYGKDGVGLSMKDWSPVGAGDLSKNIGPWKPVVQAGGSTGWSYRGQTVYTYERDHELRDIHGTLVEGAELVVLHAPPPKPPGLTVQLTLLGPSYADAAGMTLYSFACVTNAPPGNAGRDKVLSCDHWTDPPIFREQFCAGPERCGELWAPLVAPADASPRGGLWSVAVIPDPVKYPMRWAQVDGVAEKTPGAVKIYTYLGRPIYTYKGDRAPGEIWGEDIMRFSGTGRWTLLSVGEQAELD